MDKGTAEDQGFREAMRLLVTNLYVEHFRGNPPAFRLTRAEVLGAIDRMVPDEMVRHYALHECEQLFEKATSALVHEWVETAQPPTR